jgi:hypothetical protein
MNVCIYRLNQKALSRTENFCSKERVRCGAVKQLVCTAPDIWPVWLAVYGVVMLFAAQVYLAWE